LPDFIRHHTERKDRRGLLFDVHQDELDDPSPSLYFAYLQSLPSYAWRIQSTIPYTISSLTLLNEESYLLASSSNLIDSTCSLLSFFARAIYDAPSVKRAILDLDLFFDIVYNGVMGDVE
jgi:hypothetical protein